MSRVRAPGKVVVTGAYAVLAGAPAIVLAVDRYAVADSALAGEPSAELRAARPDRAAYPRVAAEALRSVGGRKLGLGSSAAVVVSALGALAADAGRALDDRSVRGLLFSEARAAHAAVQGGGSGVDIAASVYGGSIRYALRDGAAVIEPLAPPAGLSVTVVASAESARTSDLRAQVERLRTRDPRSHARCFAALGEASEAAARSYGEGDVPAFLAGARAFGEALAALGAAADAPIVLPAFAELASRAHAAGAVFFPSGAGGGDIGVLLASTLLPSLLTEALSLGFEPLDLSIDPLGVRLDP